MKQGNAWGAGLTLALKGSGMDYIKKMDNCDINFDESKVMMKSLRRNLSSKEM